MLADNDIGDYLRTLRKRKGISQKTLGQAAGIALRTLQNWEHGANSPRRVELEQVLDALEASPQEKLDLAARLTTLRGMQMAQAVASPDSAIDLGPLPNLGDLLRAMRLRRGWTQEQVASALEVSRITINRWETTGSLPTDENLERLCCLLGAYPQEKIALQRRRLEPFGWSAELSLHDCQWRLHQIRQRLWSSPVIELDLLALKRQLRLLLPRTPEAMTVLARVDVEHASWLGAHDRSRDAYILTSRALAMLDHRLPDDPLRFGVLNLHTSVIPPSANGYSVGLKFQEAWLPYLSGAYRVIPLCDMATYVLHLNRRDDMKALLAEARALLEQGTGITPDHWWYYRSNYAYVLRQMGRPYEAMELLTPL